MSPAGVSRQCGDPDEAAHEECVIVDPGTGLGRTVREEPRQLGVTGAEGNEPCILRSEDEVASAH